MEAGNEKAVLMGIDNLSLFKKIRTATELGLPVSEWQKAEIDVGSLTYTCVAEDGSVKKYDCVNKVKCLEDALRYYRIANGYSKLSPVQQQILLKCGETFGYNNVLCIPQDDITPSLGTGNANPNYPPGSPSGQSWDNFNH